MVNVLICWNVERMTSWLGSLHFHKDCCMYLSTQKVRNITGGQGVRGLRRGLRRGHHGGGLHGVQRCLVLLLRRHRQEVVESGHVWPRLLLHLEKRNGEKMIKLIEKL